MTTQSASPTRAGDRTVDHGTIVIERRFDAAPSAVFAAFADPAAKARWFAGGEGWEVAEFRFDFQVGGRETSNARFQGGPPVLYDARYIDIVPDSRIVVAYSMTLGETRISASLLTVEFLPATGRTDLVLTEQVAILDGADRLADREHGLRELVDALDVELHRTTSTSRDDQESMR